MLSGAGPLVVQDSRLKQAQAARQKIEDHLMQMVQLVASKLQIWKFHPPVCVKLIIDHCSVHDCVPIGRLGFIEFMSNVMLGPQETLKCKSQEQQKHNETQAELVRTPRRGLFSPCVYTFLLHYVKSANLRIWALLDPWWDFPRGVLSRICFENSQLSVDGAPLILTHRTRYLQPSSNTTLVVFLDS